ncbi:thiol-disulfide oxidoreductase DCC family protein [Streptacidiphilus melanogenes]|uniref:thiol-disulfide oxidoreductase DCC family protein n=1 Tax=Streptacidiphilus melanogenes TaxID=411235 RepID=UPI0007C726E8|nr:DCC1-like thiol-disulfide oxidoreductase family protein [Streptacidiphilus melanogenes]
MSDSARAGDSAETSGTGAAETGLGPDRGTGDAPVRRLTVLSDPGCPLCRHLRGWLERQRQLVPLEFVDVGSAAARARFPQLDQRRAAAEITVVGDAGQVYEGPAAWIACLWALDGYRATAHRLSSPAGAPLARAAVLAAAGGRKFLTRRKGEGRQGEGGGRMRTDVGPDVELDDVPSCGAECRTWSG